MSSDELFAAIKGGALAQVEALLTAEPGLAGARDEGGMSAVLAAAYWQQPKVLAALLAREPELSYYEAAAAGATARVAALLDGEPALLDAHAPDGFGALGLASFFGHNELASMLLGRGANPNLASANSMQVPPLGSAAAGQHLELARLLLEAGADPQATQEGGFTALHSAAQNGQRAMVELLLAYGANPAARGPNGRTPRDMAVEAGYGELAELLNV